MIQIDLTIHTDSVRKILCGFIHSEITRIGLQRAVIGLSGGIDSALSAYLAVDALGAENVLAVCMPYHTSAPESQVHAQLVIEHLKIPSVIIPITEMVDPLFQRDSQMSQTRRGNIMARARMIVLYDQSEVFRGLVVGTSNKTEILLGYSTLYGDSAYAINPIGDLYKAQVRQLAQAMGVPQVIIDKPPTADLWQGQTDEGELGFTYEMADKLLYLLVDERYTPQDRITEGFDEKFVNTVVERMRRNHFKRMLPLIAKLGSRTVGYDFLYLRDWGT